MAHTAGTRTADGMVIAERAVTIRNEERDDGADSEGQRKPPGNSEGGSCGRGRAGDAEHRAGAGQEPESRRLWRLLQGFLRQAHLPDFTEATGIAVESVAEPTGEAWLVQLQQAAQAVGAGRRLDDVAGRDAEGQAVDLWAPLDLAKMPEHRQRHEPEFVNKYPDGRVAGIGAVTWYITLVSNTNAYPTAPDSWAFLWDPSNADKLGLLALVSNSFLLEITSKTFLRRHQGARHRGGHPEGAGQDRRAEAERAPLVSRRGAVRAGAEIGRDPDGPVLSRRDRPRRRRRHPVRSTFPKEGGVNDAGSWASPRRPRRPTRRTSSSTYEPARDPGAAVAQGRHLAHGEARVARSDRRGIRRRLLRHPPIIPRYDLYQTKSDWLNQKWTELIVG